MPKKLSARLEKKISLRAYRGTPRWRLDNRGDKFEIDVFAEEQREWLPVAMIKGAVGIEAGALAEYVVSVLNEKQQEAVMLSTALRALKNVLEEGFIFSTEQEIDHAIRGATTHGSVLRDVLRVLKLVGENGLTAETRQEANETITRLKDCRIVANQF
ncbi:MAG: hypothetical protein WBP94_01240 [Rhodomicrobiaceae bacterium]